MNAALGQAETVPMIDGHVHAFSADSGHVGFDPLASISLGGDDPAFLRAGDAPPSPIELARLARQAEATLIYQYALEALAGRFGCEPTVPAVLAARSEASRDFGAYLRGLYGEMQLQAMLVDTGYPVGASSQDVALRTGIPAFAIKRIEPTIAAAWDESDALEVLENHLLRWMEHAAGEEGAVAFKSIIAYRTGLAVADVSQADARRAFDRLKKSGQGPGLMSRIHLPRGLFADAKCVRDFLLWRALESSIDLALPFQIHTGLGDADLDIQQADPGLLATVMRDRRLRRARLVLLHGAFPFHDKAAYLANVFPNVYVDLSLFSPFLVGGATRVVRTMLELAPFTKLMAGTDACGSPELHWIGVRLTRASLDAAIGESVGWSVRPDAHAHVIRRLVLRDNAAELYGLDGLKLGTSS